ncbi:MAG TPA: hypothetical protein VMT31_01425, partial [Methanomicrobiales archaeon]|nr:hypothetical protein [Methanomicrobiales archaeon]
MTERWMVHNLTRAIALIVLISVVCAPAVAHETSPDNSESGHRDRGEAGDRDRCAEITSQYTINDAITGATPHWVFLTLVQEDRQHLLDFIDSLVVPDAKKAEWKSILEDLWKKYPVDVKEGKNSLQITLKRGTPSIKLTAYEEAVLGEIDDAIAHAMEESLNSEISPMWNPDAHNQIFSSSCSSQNTGPLLFRYCIPEITDKAAEPDNWCSGNFACQMLNHGYLPSINFGLAPDNLERNATEASNKINSGEYMSGFGSLAHASHFLADIGNPLHTGEAINQIADLGMVHHAYEDYVKKNWNTLLLGADRSFSDYVTGTTDIRWNSDPLQSGRRLAGDSTLSSDALYRYIYRTFIRYDRFLPEADPRIADITIKSLVETKQYTNGLVTYATRGARIFTIRADTRPHGTVSPSGSVRVLYKTDQTFTITPDANFVISDVTVDGQSVGAVSSYTFPPVDRDHRIRATFERGFFTITPSAGSNGQISPSSPVTVPRGESQIFTITSNPGYRVRDVVVDGNSIGPVVSYTFTNVQDDHRIRATFRQTQATFTITPSAGPHGTITPSMAVTVPYAGSTTFTITPDSGYVI